ncbi:hypothetical protein [Micromonospora taraxaci]|uniref:hypothetical protein n=1 Tax=Micromonospora taraxaci TaxID=1316803 RepID=UPI0033A8B831
MYHPKRPSTSLYVVATVICTVGTIAVLARVLHNNTQYTLVEPFATLTFIYGVTYALAGPAIGAVLTAIGMRAKNAALQAEVERLRARQQTYDSLVEHIQNVDSQAEVNTVLIRKVLKQVERDRANADTQPIARLHSINGNGAG